MPVWQNYQGLQVPQTAAQSTKPRLSLTSDILSYRRCSRQYGFFGNDGFVPARATQIFYGTVIHQVLDRCHRHFDGLLGHPRGTMPTDADIDTYFNAVEDALRSHGIRAVSFSSRNRAIEVIKLFNRIEGPALYPRVRDTECRLESERADYIVRGVVDVLAASPGAPDDPAQMELWDYKGTARPANSSLTLRDYKWQMCVYAELYRVRTGVYPARAKLYFLNELQNPPPTTTPRNALLVVTFSDPDIRGALAAFDTTAADILACKAQAQWPLPNGQLDKNTCDICDVRWNCPSPQPPYQARNIFP
ncbi:MAG: PD-(D/E)XK nuclease family protein [Vulcanimicrobiaceae bacterium]